MKIYYAYQSLHHIHPSFSHCTHFSKNINRVDDTFLEFIKDHVYAKKHSSSANTSTAVNMKKYFTIERKKLSFGSIQNKLFNRILAKILSIKA